MTLMTSMTSNDPFAGIPAPIASALSARGFSELTAVQRAVVDAEFSGKDLRISSETGSGKTVAIGLALARHLLGDADQADSKTISAGPTKSHTGSRSHTAHPVGLLIVPTRELAAQVRDELHWLFAKLPGVTVEVVTGGTSIGMERRSLARQPTLVVGTPGRLLDHMRNAALDCDRIAHVVLDEADQMLDMGFREELEAILEQLPEQRSSHLVSATFPAAVRSLANRFQRDVLVLQGTELGVANQDIHHIAYAIRRNETYASLVNVLLLTEDSRCLLFVNRRVDATELAEKLARDGFGAAPFSGELPQSQRTRTLNAFRNGTLKILVSTDVAARGIDVPDISTVIHIDPPRTPDAYVHRSGRTGRAGQSGRSILLVTGPEVHRVKRLLSAARIEVSWQPIPQPDKIRKALKKHARRKLHERLSSDAVLSEAQLVYASQLLEDKDPAQLVATLLEMAAPSPPRDPMQVEGLDPFSDDRSGRGTRRGAPTRDLRGGRDRAASYTQFQVSWGERTGATASRLLSHICRRGGLASHQVGAIKVQAKSSIIDIASDVAEAFESKARRPDKRDPGILIHRLAAPLASARSNRSPSKGLSSRKPSSPKPSSLKPSSLKEVPKGPPAGPAPRLGNLSRKPQGPGHPAHLKGQRPRQAASRASR
jgi:ATP-dependent RNA helicase DeaD